jgi:hypothetical protein
MLTPLPDDWRTAGRCHPTKNTHLLTDLFFPDDDEPRGPGKRICSDCPVRFTCLEAGLDESAFMPRGNRLTGIYGGIGSSGRVHLLKLRREQADQLQHRYNPSCICRFCQDTRKLVGGTGLVNRNGDGAKCGRISTYSRGCRCTACEASMALRYRHSKTIAEAA